MTLLTAILGTLIANAITLAGFYLLTKINREENVTTNIVKFMALSGLVAAIAYSVHQP